MIDRARASGLVWILCLGLAAAAWCEPRQDAPPSWEKYKVLAERNIFLRDRSPRAHSTRAAAAPVYPVYPDEHYTVLTGIVRQAEVYVAFLEDTRTGVTSRARADGPVAQGRIVRITLNYVEYEKNGRTVKVDVGESLEGASPAQRSAPAPSVTIGATSDSSAGTPPPGGTGAEDERAILERLRQRRQKELKTK